PPHAPTTPLHPHTPHRPVTRPPASGRAPTRDARETTRPVPETSPPCPARSWPALAATATPPAAHSALYSAPACDALPTAAAPPRGTRCQPPDPGPAAAATAPAQARTRTLPGAGWRPLPSRSASRQPGGWGRRDDARAWGGRGKTRGSRIRLAIFSPSRLRSF